MKRRFKQYIYIYIEWWNQGHREGRDKKNHDKAKLFWPIYHYMDIALSLVIYAKHKIKKSKF